MLKNISNSFATLGDDFSKKSLPTPQKNQKITAYSEDVLKLLDLDEKTLKSETFLNAISGKSPDENFCYRAQIYGGHQFGHFVDLLGDGRATLLAQVKNKENQSWDLTLKGCGITAFSRPHVQNADGKSVLRSAIREYLISEHLHYLGIKTTRALCLITSDDKAQREMLEPSAQIIRVAESHIRFGSFEYFFYRRENDKIAILANYVIKNYPSLAIGSSENKYANFLENTVKSTAKMIAKWQAFGFCHGVLNTDNMSIHGITFDFGPFGFLDEYNPNHICNSSDFQGRYSYKNQVSIGLWNLHAFAITLSSLIEMAEIKDILEKYEEVFLEEYHQLMAAKLGFSEANEDVKKLIYQTLDLLEEEKIDYTNFFRNLENTDELLNLSNNKSWSTKLKNWQNTHKPSTPELIKKSNPKYILRNYLAENAIQKAENGDFSELLKLQKILKSPFEEQSEFTKYSNKTPTNQKSKKISCSS